MLASILICAAPSTERVTLSDHDGQQFENRLGSWIALIPIVLIFILAWTKQWTDDPRVGPADEIGYFAWQQSWITDFDCDPTDEIASVPSVFFPDRIQVDNESRTLNKYATGVSQVILPLTAPAQVGVIVSNRLFGTNLRQDGMAPIVVRAAWFAISLWSMLGVWCTYLTSRKVAGPIAGALATAFVWLGTAAFIYGWKLPLWSHGAGMSMVAIAGYFGLVRCSTSAIIKPDWWSAIGFGFFGAMAIAVRPTHALLIAPMGLVILIRVIRSLRIDSSGAMSFVMAGLLGGVIPLGVEMFTRHAAFGSIFFNGYAAKGEGFDWSSPNFWNVLTYTEIGPMNGGRGILTAHPITLLALLGLTLAFIKMKSTWRWYALGSIAAFVVTTYVYGSWWFWNLGWSYGARWSADFFFPLAIGVACFIAIIRQKPHRSLWYIAPLALWSVATCL